MVRDPVPDRWWQRRRSNLAAIVVASMITTTSAADVADPAANTRQPDGSGASERPSFVPDYAEITTLLDTPSCTTELEPGFDPDAFATRTVAVWTPNEILERWPPFSVHLSDAELGRLQRERPALAMALLALDVASEDRIQPLDFYAGVRLSLPADLSWEDVEVRRRTGVAAWYRTRDVLARTSEPEQTIAVQIVIDPPREGRPPAWLSIRIEYPHPAAPGRTTIETYVVRLNDAPRRRLVVAGSDGFMAGEFDVHTVYMARGPMRLDSR